MTIFEKATREKFRYPSAKGLLTTEQLWELPLTAKSGFSLDDVAKAVNAELKAVDTESFVATEANPAKATLETKLEVVKHVIARPPRAGPAGARSAVPVSSGRTPPRCARAR